MVCAAERAPGATVSLFTNEGSPSPVQWLGFHYMARDTSRPVFGTLKFRRIIVPMCLPALMTALPLVPLRRRMRRRKRQLAGLCIYCEYDLRATPGRCPECGIAAPDGEAAVA